jgi:hypothetical protein
MTREMLAELYNLYHLASTALADQPLDRQTKYDRKLWASREFHKAHPEVSEKSAYLAFERAAAHTAIPGYSVDAVDSAIASSNRSGRCIGRGEARRIHALLKGRH